MDCPKCKTLMSYKKDYNAKIFYLTIKYTCPHCGYIDGEDYYLEVNI